MKGMTCRKLGLALALASGLVIGAYGSLETRGFAQQATVQQATAQLPTYPLAFGAFVVRFDPGGSFTLQGQGWPTVSGKWKLADAEIELTMSGGPGGCDGPGRYRLRMDGNRVGFDLVSDACRPRQMILDRSTWSPASEAKVKPARAITRTTGARAPSRAGANTEK